MRAIWYNLDHMHTLGLAKNLFLEALFSATSSTEAIFIFVGGVRNYACTERWKAIRMRVLL